jgi:hypothetical protein
MIFIMSLLLLIGCAGDRGNDEYLIMNTICVDGYLCFSVTNGIECDYILVMHNNKKVECNNGQ